ncbi:MAG TPA: hypothetical protein VFH18_07165 [Erysipelotrichaceae bacterium]|nr:hypothetical protein [Erysipelotrichaceae bacterium]
MSKPNKITKIIYSMAGIFLIYSSYNYIIVKDYWQLFINFEFLLMLVYMNFYYKKKPLMITKVSLLFLLMHFIGYGIHGIILKNDWHLAISVLYIVGYTLYILMNKQKKYPIYFNPKIK